MTDHVLEGKWKQIKGRVREHWGKLTEDEIDEIDGKEENLRGKLQEKYGLASDEAKKQVREFLDKVQKKLDS